MNKDWFDKNGKKIKTGDLLFNNWNEPPVLEVLSDGEQLFLGDFKTPFAIRYGFHEFWEVK